MKPRVLIVDDSLTVRMDIGEALQSAGFDTVMCADLRSAREALAREGSVLIVLDILLPDGDGLDFLKELRSSPATAQIPVLLLSTEADAKNRVRGMGAGADEYIGKPYDLGLLVARARALTQADASGGVGLGRRVLVIDDSVTFRDELRQSLEGAGYHVREAATGEEGLALAAADRPDAVVVDGILPGIDGATVVRRLKSDTALRSTPCLLLTGAEGANDGLRALEAGAARSLPVVRRTRASSAPSACSPSTTASPTFRSSVASFAGKVTMWSWQAPARRRWNSSRLSLWTAFCSTWSCLDCPARRRASASNSEPNGATSPSSCSRRATIGMR